VLDRLVGGWLAEQLPHGDSSAVAVDGKSLRGAVGPDGRRVHLLAALVHGAGTVVAQRQVAAKTSEIGAFAPMFVTDGIEAALELARAATDDKNVGIWGGANIIREYLRAGLLDEMQIHLIPILLGDGIRLFEDLGPERIELRRTSSIETPSATHFRFEVVK
jgi:dihydrofolate reductase